MLSVFSISEFSRFLKKKSLFFKLVLYPEPASNSDSTAFEVAKTVAGDGVVVAVDVALLALDTATFHFVADLDYSGEN